MQTKDPRVPETAKQGTDNMNQDWSWVEASIWTERMLSALGATTNGVKVSQESKVNKWFSLIDKVYRPKTLTLAWKRVASKRGAAGVDHITVERFTAQEDKLLAELSSSLQNGSYKPQAVLRVEIDKGDGKKRPLGIPTVKDRVVQTGVKMTIEPILEAQFRPNSYGFRPGKGCKDALRKVDELLKQGYVHVVDADLQSYFDTIPHERLMTLIEMHISDGRILDLLRAFLKQEIMHELKTWKPITGSPQGAVISPLLANLYLHPLDCLLEEYGYQMVRYADDFVILCQERGQAQAALELVRAWVLENELTLHPDKTHLGDCRVEGQGFEFLGYRFEAGKRTVRKKSLKKLKDQIRKKTGRSRGVSLSMVIQDLNPMLRGWFNYFKHAHKRTFNQIDGMIRRRLRSFLNAHAKRHSRGRCLADHMKWKNAYFADAGLFTLQTAWTLARQSR
jgi:RNA-directed DNA polymerase